MLHRKDAGERAGVQKPKASASCVTLLPNGIVPCPDFNPEIETKHPFSVGVPTLEIIRTIVRLHYSSVHIITLGECCRDQDQWATSGDDKQQ